MKTSIINIKSDPKIKLEATKLAKELGLSLSQVIQISLVNFVQSGTIIASKPLQMSVQLEKSLVQVEKDIKKGKNLSPSFDNAKDAMLWLKNKSKKWS
jgi:addiction module RelB/DinJ family antitoxin